MPDFAALERRLQELGRPPAAREELVTRADVIALYQEIVDALNRELSQFERIKRMALLPAEFTIESGELTPTLKVKRKGGRGALAIARSELSTTSEAGVKHGIIPSPSVLS